MLSFCSRYDEMPGIRLSEFAFRRSPGFVEVFLGILYSFTLFVGRFEVFVAILKFFEFGFKISFNILKFVIRFGVFYLLRSLFEQADGLVDRVTSAR